MKRKPQGAKYRNLYAWRGTIWYERVVKGRRFRVDTETRYTGDRPTLVQWNEAAVYRDQYEEKRDVERRAARGLGAVPTFAVAAQRYLEEDIEGLAATTITDRRSHLRPDGPVLQRLGTKRLDEITEATLREWWNLEIGTTPRTRATGERYLITIAAVFRYARGLHLVDSDPVRGLREQLGKRSRTKRARAEAQMQPNPIENPEALDRLIEVAGEEGLEVQVAVLLMLDAGLRAGEVRGLTWGSVVWGEGEGDPRRHLYIASNRPRDALEAEEPKSGRTRRVQLSRRLRGALGELFRERFTERGDRYRADAYVLLAFNARGFRKGPWRRVCEAAAITGHSPKDLRASFASHLFSLGFPLEYVSRQLGHSGTELTRKVYAKWLPEVDDYWEPPKLEPGEVPADLLARLPKSPQPPHKGAQTGFDRLPKEFVQLLENAENMGAAMSDGTVGRDDTALVSRGRGLDAG